MPGLDLLLLLLSIPAPPPPPTLADCARFPSAAECQAAEDFARAHLVWLDAQAAWALSDGEHEYWQARRMEALYCFQAYDFAGAGAGAEQTADGYRLHWLGRLRELIGDDAYEAGRLPPPVPVWRFRRLD